jgi:type I restriction enzyme S subunit
MGAALRMSDVAVLRRIPVNVEPGETYREIGIRSFGRGVFHKEPVTGASLGTKRVFEIHPGDLVLSNVFAWEGAIALAGEAESGMIGSHRFMTYVVDPEVADADYLRHYFLSDQGLEQIRRASPGSAGRNRTLGIEAFQRLEVHLPSVEEQREVAQRLDHVNACAARVRTLYKHAEKLCAAAPSSLAQRHDLSESKKRALGWKRVRLSDAMSLSRIQCRVETDRTYPNVGILSFGRGLFEKPPIDGSATAATTLYQIRSRQFIYSRLFAFEGAYGAVADNFDNYYVSNEFPTFDVDSAVLDAEFLAAYFRSRDVWDELARSSHGLGSRRQRVHPEAVLELKVWIPSMDAQRRVVANLDRLRNTQDHRQHLLGVIGALESAALKRMMVGS